MVYFIDERLPELSSDHGWKGRKLPGKIRIIKLTNFVYKITNSNGIKISVFVPFYLDVFLFPLQILKVKWSLTSKCKFSENNKKISLIQIQWFVKKSDSFILSRNWKPKNFHFLLLWLQFNFEFWIFSFQFSIFNFQLLTFNFQFSIFNLIVFIFDK